MGEDLELRRRRLEYRSKHRGTKELDLLLGVFAERQLELMSARELELYEAILEADEVDIYAWLVGRAPVPPAHDNDVMRRLLSFDFPRALRRDQPW